MALSEIQCPNLAELAMDELLKIVSFGSFCSNYGLSFYECAQIMLQAPKVTFVLLSNFGNRSPFSDDYISYCENKLAVSNILFYLWLAITEHCTISIFRYRQ